MSGTSSRVAGRRWSTRPSCLVLHPLRWNSPGTGHGPFRTGPASAAGHVGGDRQPPPCLADPDVGVTPVAGTAPVAEGGPSMHQGHLAEQADQDVVPFEPGQRRGGRGTDEKRRSVEQRPVRARADEVRREMLLEPTPVGLLRGPEVLAVEPEQDLTVGRRLGREGHSSAPCPSPCIPPRKKGPAGIARNAVVAPELASRNWPPIRPRSSMSPALVIVPLSPVMTFELRSMT